MTIDLTLSQIARQTLRVDVRQEGIVRIARRQLRGGASPLDRQRWIARQYPAFILGLVEVVALVDELGGFRTHDEPVREAARNENLPPVARR